MIIIIIMIDIKWIVINWFYYYMYHYHHRRNSDTELSLKFYFIHYPCGVKIKFVARILGLGHWHAAMYIYKYGTINEVAAVLLFTFAIIWLI